MDYLDLKALHILSSTLLFGTGLGTAFFMWMTNRTRNRQAMAVVSRVVMKADLYFTTPAVIVQPITGILLMLKGGHALNFAPPNWLGLSVLLYLLAGACWLPVLWLQWRMNQLAAEAPADPILPDLYWTYDRWWTWLGIPAFSVLVVVFWLMTAKPF